MRYIVHTEKCTNLKWTTQWVLTNVTIAKSRYRIFLSPGEFLCVPCSLQRQLCFWFLSLQISSAFSKCSIEYTLVSFKVMILTGQLISLLLFIAKYYPVMCRCHTFSFLLLVDIWVFHFQFGSIMDRSALNILVQLSLLTGVLISLG